MLKYDWKECSIAFPVTWVSFLWCDGSMCALNEKYTHISTISKTYNCEVVLVESAKDSKKYLIKSIGNGKNCSRQLDLKKRFCREMDIVSSLDHPNIIKPVETYIDGNAFYIVYPYEHGVTLAKMIDQHGKFCETDALHIIKQLLFALAYIHGKGIIHADVNPCNVFITDTRKALLLDFGFSMTEDDARNIAKDRIIGTFPYLSPEQMGFTDFHIDTRTDLFCLLIVLYRMLSGKLPFPMQQETLKELLTATLKRAVFGIQNIPQFLNEILIKGLRPSPDDRYQTAEGLLDDLVKTTEMLKTDNSSNFRVGQKDAVASIIRKRLFVERSYELDLLQKGLQQLLRGKSSSFLLFGKSGIGKTEIVKEFKSSIDPEMADFISVKCNRFVPSQPYSIVRQLVIEYLAQKNTGDQSEIDKIKTALQNDIGDHSGLVCSIIPEMRSWFDNLEAISVIEKEKEADRILYVLSVLLATLCRIHKTIIFIDDMQWIDKITFSLIEKILSEKVPCLLLCNYRTMENSETTYCFGKDLASLLFSKIIHIREFGRDAIAEVIASRFGIIPNIEMLTDALLKKTDGVPFVLNEAVRYLVSSGMLFYKDSGWALRPEALRDLPEKFDSISLVLRKLDELDPEEKQVLTIASLVEGCFDNALLSRLVHKTTGRTSVLTAKLEQLGFISSDLSNGYVFIHDRIQESIASRIGDDRYTLYEQIAQQYLENANDNRERLFNAAECYLKTKNLTKAIEVSYRAAFYATEKMALDVAIRYFKNVLFIADLIPEDQIDPSIDLMSAHMTFGNVLMMTGANEQALKIFLKLLEKGCNDRYVKLKIIYKIGCIYHNVGDFEKSVPYLTEALRTLGVKLPEKNAAIVFRLITEVMRIAFVPRWITKMHKVESDQWSLLKLRILNKLSYSMYFTHMIKSMYLQFVANRHAASTVDSYEKAEAFAMHGIAAYQLLRKRRAFRNLGQSESIAQKIERADILAFCKSFSGLCSYYYAEWKKSELLLGESINLFNSIGDINNQILSAEHLWKIQLMRGNLDAALREMNKTIELCKKVNEKYYLIVTYAAINYVMLLKTGVFNKERFDDIVGRLSNVDSALFHLEAGGYLLQAEVEQGEYQAAYNRSIKLLPFILKKCINSEYQIRGYSQLCYILCKEMHHRSKGFRYIDVPQKKLTRQFIFYAAMHWFSSISFPAYKGSLYRNIAWFAAAHKWKKTATFFFRKAIKKNHILDMRYEEACALKDYGVFLEEYMNRPGEAYDQHAQAAVLFGKCGAKMQVDRLSAVVNRNAVKDGGFETEIYENGTQERQSSSGFNMVRFETLADVSKTITETDDPAILLRQILSAMITVTGAQYGCFFINTNSNSSYEPFAMTFEGNEVALSTVPVFSDLINKVNEIHTIKCTRETLLDEDIDTETETIRSDLCIPLNWREKYLGYVYLLNDRVKGLFGEAAQKSALILAAHAGILLENVNLMSKQKKFNEELRLQVAEQTDVILQKKRQLEIANLKLLESERVKDVLCGTLVHDIKNYATGISGNLEYLGRRIENDHKARKIIDVVSETCSDITSLASNLLDISKMDEGKMVLRRESIDRYFFEAMADKFGVNTLFEEKNIVPVVKFSNDIFEICADPYLVERVLQNLYSNAAKYAPRGSVVELRVDSNDDEDIVCFFNSGTPIPESEKDVLFEKYARLQDRKSQYSKGLGLFFCKMVMSAHNGRIWLDTDESGNYFKMAFPRIHNIVTYAAAS